MNEVDLHSRQGVVRFGTAQIAYMDPDRAPVEPGVRLLLLHNARGQLPARVPERLLVGGDVEAGAHVLVCGRVELVDDEAVFTVEMLRQIEAPSASVAHPLAGDDDSQESILIDLPRDVAAYLLWLICRDVARWPERRRTRLTRDDARSLAIYLHECLPGDRRTPVPPPRAAGASQVKRRVAS